MASESSFIFYKSPERLGEELPVLYPFARRLAAPPCPRPSGNPAFGTRNGSAPPSGNHQPLGPALPPPCLPATRPSALGTAPPRPSGNHQPLAFALPPPCLPTTLIRVQGCLPPPPPGGSLAVSFPPPPRPAFRLRLQDCLRQTPGLSNRERIPFSYQQFTKGPASQPDSGARAAG